LHSIKAILAKSLISLSKLDRRSYNPQILCYAIYGAIDAEVMKIESEGGFWTEDSSQKGIDGRIFYICGALWLMANWIRVDSASK
jgi:hypothetical protein